MYRLRILVGVILIGVCSSALACLWDHDTLQMERKEFPSALELIAGKFLRHSDEFYQWRVEDRSRKLKQQPTAELYDDLAVAYEKLGKHKQAIEVTLKKQELYPDLYETHANLGTFYIHSGELEKGLREIEKAIQINPDAHFGRERYQKLLVEYVLSRRSEKTPSLPLSRNDTRKGFGYQPTGFSKYVLETGKIAKDTPAAKLEIQKATTGVLGMMRFGNYDSPVLLEALGDLLVSDHSGAKRLAARAFLKASYAVEDQESKDAFRVLARGALTLQTQGKSSKQLLLRTLENTLRSEIEEAEKWFSKIESNERNWIQQGKDVDQAFNAKYYAEPKVGVAPISASSREPLAFVLVFLAVFVVSLLLVRRVYFKSNPAVIADES